jgi:hypothetical protein
MKIDSEHIVKQSEEFALNIAKQISKITVRPFCEISFHSSEYRDRKTLSNYLHKIPKSDNPLIYIIQIKSPKILSTLIDYFEDYQSANKLKVKNKDRVNLSGTTRLHQIYYMLEAQRLISRQELRTILAQKEIGL